DREERGTSHHLARADRERFGAAPAAQLEATLEHEQQRGGVVASVEQRLARGEIAFLEERGEFLAFAFAEVGEEREAFELGHIAHGTIREKAPRRRSSGSLGPSSGSR